MLKDSFVRVRDLSIAEFAGDRICALGIDQSVADHIAVRLIDGGWLSKAEGLRDGVESLFWIVDKHTSPEQRKDRCLIYGLVLLKLIEDELGFKFRDHFDDLLAVASTSRSAQFARLCAAEAGIDFTVALSRVGDVLTSAPVTHPPLHNMAVVLWESGLVEPERLIDIELVREAGRITKRRAGTGWNSGDTQRFAQDYRQPEFWIAVGTKAGIKALTPACSVADDDELALLCLGVETCTHRSIGVNYRLRPENRVWGVIDWMLERVEDRLRSTPTRQTALEHAWLIAWTRQRFRSDRVLPKDTELRMFAAADHELGSLRKLIDRRDAAEFDEHWGAIDAAIECLIDLGSLWHALGPLLLAFRKLQIPGVAKDLCCLSYGQHPEHPLPEPWFRIAESFVNIIHHSARSEQETDADLSELRSSFVRFCLDRLKTRKDGNGPTEPNAVWRFGYIKAVLLLQINPEGKGHHILFHSSKNDPDPEVRGLALDAYEVLRHQPVLKSGVSPRRVILEAFWVLRQAHLIALGLTVDERGANRVRVDELRRTTSEEELTQQ